MNIAKELWKLGRPGYIIIGLLAGILTGGGWLAWAAIQSQVGVNYFDSATGSWIPACRQAFQNTDGTNRVTVTGCGIGDVDAALWLSTGGDTVDRGRDISGSSDTALGIGAIWSGISLFNGATWDRHRSSSNAADALATSALGNANTISFPFGFNGTTFDRQRSSSNAADALATSTTGNFNSSSFSFLFNGTTFDRLRSAPLGGTINTGSLPVIIGGFDGINNSIFNSRALSADGAGTAATAIATGNHNFIFNGTTYDRSRSASAASLTATTSVGSPATVPLSTWSVTSTPAAATQATASKASGGGTVRHVATTITACSAQAAAGQTPIAINLRDGATGAGTVIRTWKIASVLGDSKCVEASGLAMIGTAATAMTIEFAAAGVAGSEQTVALTGFSVP